MKKNLSFILLLLITLIGCNTPKVVVKTIYLDEAFSIIPIVSIIDYEHSFDKIDLQSDLSKITNKLDEKFNVFKNDSLISKVNNNAGVQEVQVDDEFIYVLQEAINISKDTKIKEKALYDVSIYSVWKEWKFNENYYQYYNYASPPPQDIIKQKLPLVNYERIKINYENKTVYLEQSQMAIDLGSIVKGYAADKISEYLLQKGYQNCLIDVGGNIVTLGKNIGTNKNWKAGILMPYTYADEIGYINTLDTKETFVTSGIYERYIVEKNTETNEEIMYHHILNPHTGYPENNELLSVTIITTQSIYADALSTAVFLMGLHDGYNYVLSNKNIDAIFITKDKEIIITPNIEKRFIINEKIYQHDYKILNYDLI